MNFLIYFFLFMFGAFPGLFFCMYEEAAFIIIPWAIMGVLLIFVFICMNFYKQQKYRKTKTYQELSDYIASILNSRKELHSVIKNVRLVVMPDSDCRYDFNGQACMFNRIKITHSWFVAASVSQEAMCYLKGTICHELSHLYSMRVNKTPIFSALNFYILLKNKKKVVEASVAQWLEELRADFIGCILYDNKEVFVEKMIAMNRLYPVENKPSTHPSWPLRIHFIENNIEPTYDTVKQACLDYYKNIGYID